MPRYAWLLATLFAIVAGGAMLLTSPHSAVANEGLNNHLCDEGDANNELMEQGYTCYYLYNKGQLTGQNSFEKVGEMYLLLDGTTLNIQVSLDSGSTDFSSGQVCLDDDTDPINDSPLGAPPPSNHCLGTSGTVSLSQGGVFGASVGDLDCSGVADAADKFAYFVNVLGSADNGIHVQLPNVSNCPEVAFHFNSDDLSILGFGQPGVSEGPQEVLTVIKTVETSYRRKHNWDISKSVVTENGFTHNRLPKIWLYTDGSGDETATWRILVTYLGARDSEHVVSGVITVRNDGDTDAVIESIVDELAGEVIYIDCGDATFPDYLLGPGEQLECTYSVSVDDKIEGTNVVTVETEVRTYEDKKPIRWGDPTTELYATVGVRDESDLDGTNTLGTFTAPNGGRIVYTRDFAWEDYGQEGCGDYVYDNTATVVGFNPIRDVRVDLASDDATLAVNVQCFLDETAWAANGDTPGLGRYNSRGNWATYVQYEGVAKCTTLFAGQTINVGQVCFSAVSGGSVTIEVTLTDGNAFADVGNNLKVQGYASQPSGNPAPGQFANKKTCDTSSQVCQITVPAANYYGVHVDTWVADPDFGP